MDPSAQAVLIRALSEYDWETNCPPKEQINAFAAYTKALEDCAKIEFTKDGLRAWNESLDYSEQFDSLLDAGRFVKQAQQSLFFWRPKA